jgi:DNA-binding CsgD family transcriptional regulator
MVFVHRQGRLEYANRAFYEAFRIARGERGVGAAFGDIFRFVAPEERAAALFNYDQLMARQRPVVNIQRLLVDARGRRVLSLGASTPILWRGAAALYVCSLVVEVTGPVRDDACLPTGARTLTLLTPRERHVALLVARGFATTAIATATGLQESSVRTLIKRIYGKTGAHSRVRLAQLVTGMSHEEGFRPSPSRAVEENRA